MINPGDALEFAWLPGEQFIVLRSDRANTFLLSPDGGWFCIRSDSVIESDLIQVAEKGVMDPWKARNLLDNMLMREDFEEMKRRVRRLHRSKRLVHDYRATWGRLVDS
jgi:hypothetical protein